MLYAVIMGGGKGRRFWPKSRKNVPKQFIPLVENKTLLKATVERLGGLIPHENILIVTNETQRKMVLENIPTVSPQNIITEPYGKDTAPCIALATAYIYKRDPSALMLVLPSDHYIRPKQKFHQSMQIGSEVALYYNAIVTFGIKPSYPATGYGYIMKGDKKEEIRKHGVYEVRKFVEKPSQKKARQYVKTNQYFWNSGIFIWKISTIIEMFKKHYPKLSSAFNKLLSITSKRGYRKNLYDIYQNDMPKISIDYAIIEKAKEVYMIEADFKWNDLGSWRSLENVLVSNKERNIIIGRHCGIDSKNLFVFGNNKHLISTIGVSNLIIVHTPYATLICNKNRAEDVKKLYDKIKQENLEEYL